MPNVFEYKKIGKSKYYYTDYYGSLCKVLKRKKEQVPFIESNYVDGTCIKEEVWYPNKYVKYFCSMDGVIAYIYNDSNCT